MILQCGSSCLRGVRLSELRFLRWKNWNRGQGFIEIEDSKTDAGIRSVPDVHVSGMLKILYARERPRENDFIFPGWNGEVIHKMHFQYICNKVTKHAGMRHVSPHMLRHTFATRMVEAGADIKSLSMILGHTDVAFTLKTYVKPDKSHLVGEMEKLSEMRRPA